ncbi:hypothetical protein NHX12_012024 [Muraenolepis orangiensis]|uniref:Uncharacterized protein n=1 Tax=Muraenolepis orangiensis TaxID=630683 RepID=A0A9Q0I9D2_9TELE|nr:hypothetical protein NHX12_012024 [Muraenolepis orangiensis]
MAVVHFLSWGRDLVGELVSLASRALALQYSAAVFNNSQTMVYQDGGQGLQQHNSTFKNLNRLQRVFWIPWRLMEARGLWRPEVYGGPRFMEARGLWRHEVYGGLRFMEAQGFMEARGQRETRASRNANRRSAQPLLFC